MKHLFTILLIFLHLSLTFSQENTSILCSDGIDNDNDGLIDCEDSDCILIPNDGCTTCSTGISFADVVIDYQSGCVLSDNNPEGALGVSDYWGNDGDELEFVFLGEGGFIKLGFTNNILSNSGNSDDDVYIFEVGPLVEPLSISLRPKNAFTESALINGGMTDPDGDGFYYISNLGGATSSLDLDAFVVGYPGGQLLFDAIEILDDPEFDCAGDTPGADIDAVCAIFSLDCAGTQNGTAIIDDCGECLELNDPSFNISCSDCLGIPNGTAVIDVCGECLDPNDPNFGVSCIDCFGEFNGTAVIDECGECLSLNDPNFNLSCIDCLGTPNGTAIVDDCGICLDVNAPNFNLDCLCCDVYIPNIFSPNSDGYNDVFRLYSCDDNDVQISSMIIYDRWGNQIYMDRDFKIDDTSIYWDGSYRGAVINPGVYTYYVESICKNVPLTFVGTVTLLR